MTIKEKTFQLYHINRTKLESILNSNESININILSGNSLIPLEQLRDIDTSEVSIHPMNDADISCSVKISSGTVFLTDKYHYDKGTNTLSLFKLI
jgi:hypothetical protein